MAHHHLKLALLLSFTIVYSTTGSADAITYRAQSLIDTLEDPDNLLGNTLGIDVALGVEITAELTIHDITVQPAFEASITADNSRAYFLPPSASSFSMTINGQELTGTDEYAAIAVQSQPDLDFWFFAQHLAGPESPEGTSLLLVFEFLDGGTFFPNNNKLDNDDFFVNDTKDGWDGGFVALGRLEGDFFDPQRQFAGFLTGAFVPLDNLELTTTSNVSAPHSSVLLILIAACGLLRGRKFRVNAGHYDCAGGNCTWLSCNIRKAEHSS